MIYPQEKLVLKYLARGKSSAEICEALNITRATLHTTCYNIRKKTGIKSTKDVPECRDYINGQGDSLQVWGARITRDKEGPTQAQLRAFVLFAQGKTVQQICSEMGLKLSTVGNHLSTGCKRAKINRYQIKDYVIFHGLEQRPKIDPLNDPMFS